MVVIRRAAFDIGSGATKLQIADVELGPPSRLVNILFARETPLSFAAAWKQSADGTLSDDVQAQGIAIVRGFVQECETHGADLRCAVATEVFRKASNGSAYLARLLDELGLDVKLVTQAEEAKLGFLTAVALSDRPEEDVVCWDSGGASFQLIGRDPEGGLRTCLGSLGAGIATAMLVEEVQGLRFAETPSPNPVSRAQAEALVERMRRDFTAAPWLAGKSATAIGGPNSLFCLASEISGKQTFAKADVEAALAGVLDSTDEELAERHCQGEFRDPASFICPKLCLLLAVISACDLADVTFQSAIGSCPGLLLSADRYPQSA